MFALWIVKILGDKMIKDVDYLCWDEQFTKRYTSGNKK